MRDGSRPTREPPDGRRARLAWRAGRLAIVAGLGVSLIWLPVAGAGFAGPVASAGLEAAVGPREPGRVARRLAYEVVNSYPHDPTAFLQGLVWSEGGFFESTGLAGRSTLRRVEFPSGRVLQAVALAPDLFGEGLALAGNRLVQLTWQSRRGFVYDRDSLRLLREFTYDSDGWGLTYDGRHLVLSDGSDTLTYLDPETFAPVRRLPVRMNGRPVVRLNELEFIEGEIWANVWPTDLLVRIHPATGQVNSYLDLTGLLPAALRTGREDALNGIAYDAQGKRIFVGGKLWPLLFEIRVRGGAPPRAAPGGRVRR